MLWSANKLMSTGRTLLHTKPVNREGFVPHSDTEGQRLGIQMVAAPQGMICGISTPGEDLSKDETVQRMEGRELRYLRRSNSDSIRSGANHSDQLPCTHNASNVRLKKLDLPKDKSMLQTSHFIAVHSPLYPIQIYNNTVSSLSPRALGSLP